MAQISAKLHPSLGSFPSSCSLIGFLSSDEQTSPIKTYPVYASNNRLIILNEEYKMQHSIEIGTEIKHISCHRTKIAICTVDDVRIMQRFGVELRTLCILDEQHIDNSCFFLNGNGLCIVKKTKITLYAVTDIINRYHAQLDAIEKQKEKLKKRKKIGKGLESGATTPKSLMSELEMDRNEERMQILFNLSENKEDESEIDVDFMMDDDKDAMQHDINAMIVRYRTIYIDTHGPNNKHKREKEWIISQICMCCLVSFWWIALIDNEGTLHVIKLIGGWPSTLSLNDIVSTCNTQRIDLWQRQDSMAVSRVRKTTDDNTSDSWLIGMWSWCHSANKRRNIDIRWYALCGKTVLIVLDEKGSIHLWNEPSYNYILSSLSSYDANHFIFRCILSLDQKKFVGFQCIDNILCDLPHFNTQQYDKDYIWLLTLDSVGTITIYFIQNIALFECGKASLIKFTEIEKGIIYRLQNISKSVAKAYMFDTSRGISVSSYTDNPHSISSPTLIELYTFFHSGILAHFTIDINHKHVICNRMLGGNLANDTIIQFSRHPSLRYNIFAALSSSKRLCVFDYSQNLDSTNCNDAPKLIYVVPYKPILAFAWDQNYRRLLCVSAANDHSQYKLSVHVYKSKNGWYQVYQTPIRLNPKQKIISMFIAPYTLNRGRDSSSQHHKKRRKTHKGKSNIIIICQETTWSGNRIDLDKLSRPYESTKPFKDTKEEKSSETKHATESFDDYNSNRPKILIHKRPYGELKAHRDRIRRRPPSEAPNSLYQWKKADRRPAPLVVRSVKVDKLLYQQQSSFTTEMLAGVIGEQYGINKRLVSCAGFACNDRVILVCVFNEYNARKQEDRTSCACYTIHDDATHKVSQIVINEDKITKSHAGLLRAKCISASRIMLIHETEGILLYENESSSDNEWIFELHVPYKERIELLSMINTAGGSCIATSKHTLGSTRLLFPVLSDLSTAWDHNSYFRTFELRDLIMAQLNTKHLETIQKEYPEDAEISALVFLSATVLLLYRTDIHQWIITRISTTNVAGWPGRPLYHPLALYQDMKCTNFKRIHRILKDFLTVLRKVPEEQYGNENVHSKFLVPIHWLLDKDAKTETVSSHLQFDASADCYLKPAEVNELHDLLQKIQLPMVSQQHNLTLLALTQTLRSVQEQQRNLDIPGTQFMFASNLFKLKRTASVPLGCIAYAMHSDSQDALHDLCIPKTGDISYDIYKHLGVAYWVRNKKKLEQLIDKLAIAIYRRSKNPIESTLWYILLNKKRILVSLLKISSGKEKVHKFMSRDFSIARNQNAARQNAVSLTSKHKFINACAFWILAGSYEPAINVALQNLDDPHLALLMARMLWQNKDNAKYEEVLQNKILPAISSKFHHNLWEQHMILWLLRKPEDSVRVFVSKENKNLEMSDAPEIYAFISYLKENEIVKSVREKQAQNNTSANASAAIFASPIFDMFDMGDFDYASGTFTSKSANEEVNDEKESELKSSFEPKAYDLASKVITDEDITQLLRRSAVSLSRCGLLIHALESVEQVMNRNRLNDKNDNNNSLQSLQSKLLWRFLCVRGCVMEISHDIEAEQTKDDFADLSARFPQFDALSTLNYLYGECHLRGYLQHSCNIPSGPTLTRLLIVLSGAVSHLTSILSHRVDRFSILSQIDMLFFMGEWRNVVHDLGLLGKERRIASAAITGIVHCGIFLQMFGLNRYDVIEAQICRSNLSQNVDLILEWFNDESLNQNSDYLDDEYYDNLAYLQREEEDEEADALWSNAKLAHGPMELLAITSFRFTILERFLFLFRKLLKKIGLHAAHFIDLGSLYTQLTSWLLSFCGDLRTRFSMSVVYCLENRVNEISRITEVLTKYNSIAKDEKTETLFSKLEVGEIMNNLREKIELFRRQHEEKKESEFKRDEYGYDRDAFQLRIARNNANKWHSAHDIFRVEGDLVAAIAFNNSDNEWCVIATSSGLREISIDCSLRFRLRSADGTNLLDSEYDNYNDCLLRFRDIESPKHTEIFGMSPFGGSGDKNHCKPYSISSSSKGINENAKPYPISPLLPRIQLKRYSVFLYNKHKHLSSSSPAAAAATNAMKMSPNMISLNLAESNKKLSLQRKPSEIYFPSLSKNNDSAKKATTFMAFNESEEFNKKQQQKTNLGGIELKKSLSGGSTKNNASSSSEPAAAVTSLFKCNQLNGFSSYSLDIPLFYCCLELASISSKRRSLSNTYRFYWKVICQQNRAKEREIGQRDRKERKEKEEKELQISDRDYLARNEGYLVIATHPNLPLYISANTKSDGMRLWHFQHEYPLASFSLPLSKQKTTNLSSPQSQQQQQASSQSQQLQDPPQQKLSRSAAPSRSSRSLHQIDKHQKHQKQKKQTPAITPIKTSNKTNLSSSQSQLQSHPSHIKSNSQTADYMTSLKFNEFGNKIAAISQNGNIYLWHFNVPRSIFRREFRAYATQNCHDKFGNDLVFVAGSSCIATAGESHNNANVCIWDLLFADDNRSLIRSYACYEGSGANCIEYCQDIDAVIVGGSKGVLNMFDKRIPFPICKWTHGQSRIWKLSYCRDERQLLVATLEGEISIWDIRKLYKQSTLNVNEMHMLPEMQLRRNTATSLSYASLDECGAQSLKSGATTNLDLDDECIVNQWKLFQRKAFINNSFGAAQRLGYVSSLGLTDACWTNNGDILCCGSDGSVKFIKRKTKFNSNSN